MASETDSSDGREAVLLLHGFASHAAQNLPLAGMLRQHGYKPHLLGYDSFSLDLAAIRDRLLPRIRKIAARSGTLHIVAHSMGGLVVRALLAKHRPERLGHVIMLGTPHGGSEIADFLLQHAMLRPVLGQAADALTTHRSQKINAMFGPVDYSLGVIAGNKPFLPIMLASLIPGANDGKVSVASTFIEGAADRIILPLPHTALLFHMRSLNQISHFLEHGKFDHQA